MRTKRPVDETNAHFRITQKQIDTMRKHREAGNSIGSIAEVMGFSPATVHEHTKDIVPRVTIVSTPGSKVDQAKLWKDRKNA